VARVLVCSADPVGRNMAGPGIRYLHIARQLAKAHDVTLAVPDLPALPDEPFEWVAAPRRLAAFATRFDTVIAQRLPPATMHRLARSGTRTIYDLYAPSLVEALALLGADGGRAAELRYGEVRSVQRLALALGDAFLCASERQRDLWLGALAALGRLDVKRYRQDPALRRLVAVVPFGLEARRPIADGRALEGVLPEGARVLLWGGGVWDWLDPLTVIRAIAELSRTREDVCLYFPGTRRPGSETASGMAARARSLARELGLEGRSVVFSETWVPYAERERYLLAADVGVSAHLDTVEARFAFRTRVLDYLWAELPCVVTQGDVLADMIAERGVGLTVPPGDVTGWVDALGRLLGDDEALARAREAARSVRAELEWPRVVEPLARLVADPPSPARKIAPGLLARTYLAGVRSSLAGRGLRGTAAALARRLTG
jgi:glycosyltransferase involved in cell wall biosynthesis